MGNMMKALLACVALILASNNALAAKDICDDAYAWTIQLEGNSVYSRTLLDLDSAREVFIISHAGSARQVLAIFTDDSGPHEVDLLQLDRVGIVRMAKKLELQVTGSSGTAAYGCFNVKWLP